MTGSQWGENKTPLCWLQEPSLNAQELSAKDTPSGSGKNLQTEP